jgi:exosortase A-associated hydrolase 1
LSAVRNIGPVVIASSLCSRAAWPDLRAAIDAFMMAVPGMREVVLWGLCDAASAITMYAAKDARVGGLVLLNPWVRTPHGIAKVTLKHYYRERLLDRGFWRKIVGGRFKAGASFKSMAKLVSAAFSASALSRMNRDVDGDATGNTLPDRMYASMRAFGGHVLVVVGGADLTGREFCDLAATTPKWKRLLDSPRVSQRSIEQADHTFSRRSWRDQVAHWTCEWMRSW